MKNIRAEALIITVTPIPRETFAEAVAFLRLYCLRAVDAGTAGFDLVWRSPRPTEDAGTYDVWREGVDGSYTLRRKRLSKPDVIKMAKVMGTAEKK